MKTQKKNIINSINPNYFWDIDFASLEPEKSKRLIIERVFTLGTSREILFITNYYGKSIILSVLRDINYLDIKTLNFISKLFNAPVNTFKCYTRKQSIPQHWDC